jgi:uncharacterized membrane protein YeaQ/YmgE (transglycosylase-associated protein family)
MVCVGLLWSRTPLKARMMVYLAIIRFLGWTRWEGSMLEPQSLIAWIVIGAIAGWLAGLLVKGYGFGLVGNIVVGIVGAAVAGFLASQLHLYTESTVGNIIAATIGAVILLLLVGLVRRAWLSR